MARKEVSLSLTEPATEEVRPRRHTPGINLIGYLRTESGVGALGRSYARALARLGLPVAHWDISCLQGNRAEDDTSPLLHQAAPHDMNLVSADVELHYTLLEHLGERFFRGRYNIALWAWELPRFPMKWFDRFAYYDEVWVGSSYIANSLAPIAPIPVIRIPPVLTPLTRGSREAGRQHLQASRDEFVFLFVFDFHSHTERKNPMAIVEAFRRAFAPSDRVRLVLKCVNAETKPDDALALQNQAASHRITIASGYWPAGDLRDLMEACDGYISLHRAEGLGLTITDALALGKPVIATGWSGNMDFMDVSTSFPVRYELTDIAEGVGPYAIGETWAEPSIEHAVELMRWVVSHRSEAEAQGRAAQARLAQHFGEEAVGAVIRQRLHAISVRQRLAAFRQESRAHVRRYRRLPGSIRKAVAGLLPAGARVLVVSKGDEALLRLGRVKSEHFPQTSEGIYAGYYPRDSAEAVEHLEQLRAQGAEYILFPESAFWWLVHYEGLRQHLEQHARQIAETPHCILFRLASGATSGGPEGA